MNPKMLQQEKTFVIRSAPYTYLHLSLTHLPDTTRRAPLDAITTRSYLTSALSQFLGLTGSAISVDILDITERHVWIRVPREDASAVVAALGQWADPISGVSFKIEGHGQWLGGIVATGEARTKKLFSLER